MRCPTNRSVSETRIHTFCPGSQAMAGFRISSPTVIYKGLTSSKSPSQLSHNDALPVPLSSTLPHHQQPPPHETLLEATKCRFPTLRCCFLLLPPAGHQRPLPPPPGQSPGAGLGVQGALQVHRHRERLHRRVHLCGHDPALLQQLERQIPVSHLSTSI